MFNRTMQVSFPRKTKAEKPQPEGCTHEQDIFGHIYVLGRGAVGGAALLIAAYVGMDTLRQVAVNASQNALH